MIFLITLGQRGFPYSCSPFLSPLTRYRKFPRVIPAQPTKSFVYTPKKIGPLPKESLPPLRREADPTPSKVAAVAKEKIELI